MNLKNLAAVFAAAVILSVSAHAATISGNVWYGLAGGGVGGVQNPPPASTPSATFTVTGSANTLFNFQANSGGSNYFATPFLTSSGDTLNYLTGGNGSLNNTEFQFTGTASLTAGTTYIFYSDDGMELFLTGNGLNNFQEISSPIGFSSFTVATTGLYNFNLLYAEVAGAPADLVNTSGNFTVVAPTPEPSSIVMLGSGLLAGAGMIRRRIKA